MVTVSYQKVEIPLDAEYYISGNKVRARPDQVLFNTPTAHSAIYSYRAPTKRSRWYDGMRRNDNDFNIITDPTPAGHARRRRAYNPAFTEASLRPAALVMAKHIDRWLDLLAPRANEEWSEKRDMAKWGSALTFDVLGELCFGRSFETKEEGENPLKVIPHEFEVYIRGQYVVSLSKASNNISDRLPSSLRTTRYDRD